MGIFFDQLLGRSTNKRGNQEGDGGHQDFENSERAYEAIARMIKARFGPGKPFKALNTTRECEALAKEVAGGLLRNGNIHEIRRNEKNRKEFLKDLAEKYNFTPRHAVKFRDAVLAVFPNRKGK